MTKSILQWPWEKEKITEIWRWPIIFWLNIFGWWAEEAPSPFWRKWLSRLRVICFINASACFWSMIIAIIVKFSQGDIMVNLFSVFGAGPGVVGTFKIIQCIRYRKPLKKAMDLLDGKLLIQLKKLFILICSITINTTVIERKTLS